MSADDKKLGEHLDLMPPEKQIEVLDEVYEEIWNSNQDLGSKQIAAQANRKKREEILNKMNKKGPSPYTDQ